MILFDTLLTNSNLTLIITMNYNLAHKGLGLFSIKAHSNFIVYVKTKFFFKKSVSYIFYLLLLLVIIYTASYNLLVIIKETHSIVKIFFNSGFK